MLNAFELNLENKDKTATGFGPGVTGSEGGPQN